MSEFERHEGQIHDRVQLWAGDKYKGDICVMAGNNDADVVAFHIQSGALFQSMRLLPADAAKFGRLLIAAAQDTVSRPCIPSDAGTDEGEQS